VRQNRPRDVPRGTLQAELSVQGKGEEEKKKRKTRDGRGGPRARFAAHRSMLFFSASLGKRKAPNSVASRSSTLTFRKEKRRKKEKRERGEGGTKERVSPGKTLRFRDLLAAYHLDAKKRKGKREREKRGERGEKNSKPEFGASFPPAFIPRLIMVPQKRKGKACGTILFQNHC